MADTKISTLTELPAPPVAGDHLVVVDVSDTTQAASGTTKRVLWSNFSSRVNVKSYGATGDGSTDDSAAIASANTAAAGGALVFPPGVYVAENVQPAAGTTWISDGATLKHKANSAVALVSIADGTNDVTIRNFEFDGNIVNQSGTPGNLVVARGFRHNIVDNYLHDGKRSAIQVFAASAGGARNITVQGNRIEEFEYDGVLMLGQSGTIHPTDIIVRGNHLLNCAKGGETVGHSIHLNGIGKRILVIGNVIKSIASTSGSGIEGYAAGIEDYQIIGNIVDTVGHHGSHVGGSRVMVVGNRYRNTDLRAILLASDPNTGPTFSTDFLVADNIIDTTADTTNGNGIEVHNYARGVISGNTVKDAAAAGINVTGYAGTEIGDCTDITINANMVYSSGTSGIRLNDVQRIAVTNNISRDNVSSGIIIQDDADGVVADVLVSGNVAFGNDRGIRTVATDIDRVLVQGNVSRGNTTTDYDVQNKSNIIVRNNITGASSTVASGATVNLPEEIDDITISSTATINTITASYIGRRVLLRFSSTAALADGAGNLLLKSATFTGAAERTIELVCDGTNWQEIGRSMEPSSAYTVTNVTTDRTYNANSYTMDELADVLGTLIADLQTRGLLS